MRMKLMIVTDDPCSGSGFGEEMKNVAFRLAQTGEFEIIWFSLQHTGYPVKMYDYQFEELPQKGAHITVVGGRPEDIREYGASIFPKHWVDFSPDAVMFMGDPKFVVPYVEPVGQSRKDKMGFPLFMYVTLDGLPVHPSWLKALRRVNVLIAMTEWAQVEYMKAGLAPAFVHHGIDWNLWSVSQERKMELRKKYKIPPDVVVFGNWEVNQHRKRTDALLRCWKAFKPESKKAQLLLYTDWRMERRLGWNLYDLIRQIGVPRNTVIDPIKIQGSPKYWEVSEPPSKVREIAALVDVFVSTTSGEGFGKCALEALSLGIPVVITDYSACPEVCAKGSILVPITGTYRMDDRRRSVEGGLVDEAKFTAAMEQLYYNEKKRRELGAEAREWARGFDYDTMVMPQWLNLLERVNPDEIMVKELLRL